MGRFRFTAYLYSKSRRVAEEDSHSTTNGNPEHLMCVPNADRSHDPVSNLHVLMLK
jgi:hypothetical protein